MSKLGSPADLKRSASYSGDRPRSPASFATR